MPDDHARIDRRRFLQRSAWGLGLGVGWPAFHAAAAPNTPQPPLSPSQEMRTVLFQGNSITDAGRSKDDQRPNQPHSLGSGYAGIAAARLLGEHPGSPWQCYNRGISGNKVYQLADRWEEDCLALQPDVLSILIGVNDFWHTLSGNYDGTVEVYERDYRTLLDRTREALPDVQLIIGEPFALTGGSAVDDTWYPAFDAYRAAAQRVANDYDAVWIPYQSIFDAALQQAPAPYWSEDGVHPTPAGNYLMAQSWLDAFGKVRP